MGGVSFPELSLLVFHHTDTFILYVFCLPLDLFLHNKQQVSHPSLLLLIVSQGNVYLPPSLIQKTPYQGFWSSVVHVLRLQIRFVRQDLTCVPGGE